MISWILALSLSAFGPPGLAHTPADIAWVVSGEFCEPETVLPLPDDTLLVSNVCGYAQPGTGFLSLISAGGEVLSWRRVEGLDSPLGMALRENRLYVVDGNRVRIFSYPGFIQSDTIELDTQVANDIAVGDDGSLYVSDTAGGKVVRVRLGTEAAIPLGEIDFPGANGIAIRGRELFVGGARLWRMDLDSGAVHTVGPEWLADIDGIEFQADGILQLTPVGGPLVLYRSEEDIEIVSGEGISSANHGYSARLGLVLIPTGFDNSVIALRLP